MQGIATSFKKICGQYGIQTYVKGNTTIKQILIKPKDQDPRTRRVWYYAVTNVGTLPAVRNTQEYHQGSNLHKVKQSNIK